MAPLFQLYGVLLLNRGLVQQILRSRRDLDLFRKFLYASLPFSIGSTVVLMYAVLQGLMGTLVGLIVMAPFLIEVVGKAAILYLTREVETTPGTDSSLALGRAA